MLLLFLYVNLAEILRLSKARCALQNQNIDNCFCLFLQHSELAWASEGGCGNCRHQGQGVGQADQLQIVPGTVSRAFTFLPAHRCLPQGPGSASPISDIRHGWQF